MAIQFRKKMAYAIVRVLQASYVINNTSLQRNFTVNNLWMNRSNDVYPIENIPKTSKNAARILQCEFFLIASLKYSINRISCCLWFTADFKGRQSSFALL